VLSLFWFNRDRVGISENLAGPGVTSLALMKAEGTEGSCLATVAEYYPGAYPPYNSLNLNV
jgi:hypothetical protein